MNHCSSFPIPEPVFAAVSEGTIEDPLRVVVPTEIRVTQCDVEGGIDGCVDAAHLTVDLVGLFESFQSDPAISKAVLDRSYIVEGIGSYMAFIDAISEHHRSAEVV
jgi:hypothetical protein